MSAVDRINAVLAQSFETAQDKRAALMAARAAEFSGVVGARDITRGRYGLSILRVKVSSGVIELFVRAYRDGEQIGFGPNGAIDVERFVIVNPPMSVRDDAGDVVRSGAGRSVRYRIDPDECIVSVLIDAIREKGTIGSKRIIPGKEGRTTYTVYASVYGSQIHSQSGVYSTARTGAGLAADSTELPQLGQGTAYHIYEAFLSFDTSSVLDTITTATLSIFGVDDQSTTDFTINARRLSWESGGLTTADWIAGGSLSAQTLLATLSTSGFNTSGYNAFTSQAAFLTNINQAGETGMVLSSSRHEGNNQPTSDEYINFYSADAAGTTNDPKLVIDTVPAGQTAAKRMGGVKFAGSRNHGAANIW